MSESQSLDFQVLQISVACGWHCLCASRYRLALNSCFYWEVEHCSSSTEYNDDAAKVLYVFEMIQKTNTFRKHVWIWNEMSPKYCYAPQALIAAGVQSVTVLLCSWVFHHYIYLFWVWNLKTRCQTEASIKNVLVEYLLKLKISTLKPCYQ